MISGMGLWAQQFPRPTIEEIPIPIDLYKDRLYGAYYHLSTPMEPQAHDYLQRWWRVKSVFALRNWKFPFDARSLLTDYPEGPSRESILLDMAHFFFYHRRYDSAHQYLQRLNPEHLAPDELAEFFFMKGYTALRQGDSTTALTHFETLTEGVNRYSELAHLLAGVILFSQQQHEQALAHFRAIEHQKRFRDVIPAFIAQSLWYLRRLEDLISYADGVLRQGHARHAEIIRLVLVRSLFLHGTQCNAVTNHLELLPESYWTPFEYFIAGVCALNVEDPERTLRHLDRATFSDPLLRQYVEYLKGQAWYVKGNYVKAMQAFEVAHSLGTDPTITEHALYNAGVAAIKAGQGSIAFKYFKKLIEKYPRSNHRQAAVKYLGKLFATSKDYPQALKHLRGMLVSGHEFPRIFQRISYQYGRRLLEDGQPDKAIPRLHDAVRIGDNDTVRAKAYFLLGEAYFQTHNPGEAIKQWRNFLYMKAGNAFPYRKDAYYHIGYAHLALKNPKGALPYFRRYLQEEKVLSQIEQKKVLIFSTDPRVMDAVLRLGDIYYTFRNWDQAMRFYRYVAESGHRQAPYAWLHIARIHKVRGKSAEQAVALQKVLETAPHSSKAAQEALYAIGNLHLEEGHFRMAVETFRRFEREFPRSPWMPQVLEKLALAHYNAGDDNRALEVIKRLLRRFPNSESARGAAQLARNIYVDKGQADDYIQLLEETNPTLARHFDRDSLAFESAFSWVRKDSCAEAIRTLESYLRRFRNGAYALKAHHYAATCALQLGDTARALHHFEAIFAAEPNRYSLNAVMWLARLYHHQGACERAVRYAGILEEIAGDVSLRRESQTIRMECYYQMGKWRQVATLASKLLKADLGSTTQRNRVEFYRARSLYKGGDTAEAADLLNRLRKNADNQWGAWAALELAQLRRYQQQLDEAKNIIFDMRNRFAAYPTTLAKAYLLLGEILLDQGDTIQARFTYESLMNYAPDKSIRQKAKQRYDALAQP